MRTTHSNASTKRSWSQIVIPIVIAVVAAVPAWSMFGVMLLNPSTFLEGLFAASAVFVAVGALPWFLYADWRSKLVDSQPQPEGPTFSAKSVVWRASSERGKPVSVIVDRTAGMIHFQNCAILQVFWLGSPLPWFSCSLSDLRCFHESPVKGGRALVIKTGFGKVTVFVRCDLASFQALFGVMQEVIPGGHRRFHEDHPLAILLYVVAGGSAAALAGVLVPERLNPFIGASLVLSAGVAVTLAVRQAISFWSGTPSQRRSLH